MDRVGLALIGIGIILIVLPTTGVIRAATIYLVPANEVWWNWYPRGTADSPVGFTAGTAIPIIPEVRRFKGSEWQLPGACGDWKVSAMIYKRGTNTLVKNITYNSLIQDSAYTYICKPAQPYQQVSDLAVGNYTITWRLAVFDGSSFLGYVVNPSQSHIAITVVPDGYFTVNGVRVEPNGRLVTQSPVTFVFTATAHADAITRVRIVVARPDGTILQQFDLTKTSAAIWEGVWTTSEKGQFTVNGFIHTSTNSWQKLSMIMDFGGDGGGGFGISPLQLLGILSLLAGAYLSFFRRRR